MPACITGNNRVLGCPKCLNSTLPVIALKRPWTQIARSVKDITKKDLRKSQTISNIAEEYQFNICGHVLTNLMFWKKVPNTIKDISFCHNFSIYEKPAQLSFFQLIIAKKYLTPPAHRAAQIRSID